MTARHPFDQQVAAEWDRIVAKIDAAFNDSPLKGAQCEHEAYLCLASQLIPEKFKWEPVLAYGQQRPRIVLIAYFPEFDEVLPPALAAKHGFVSLPSKKELH